MSFPRRWRHAAATGALCLCCAGAVGNAWGQARYESTVSASRDKDAPAPLEDRAADASVITDDRTPRAGESLPQLLAELPGVTVTRLGGIGSLALISLRGSTPQQVAVYVDGVPLNSALGGGVDLSSIPLGDVARIEVYRGATPIAFGGSALGGVVSVTTRAPEKSAWSVEEGLGSFGTYSGGASASWAGARLKLYAGVHALTTTGDFLYSTDHGTAFVPSSATDVQRANNAATQVDGVVRAVLPISPGRELSASALAFYRAQGVPGTATIGRTEDTHLGTLRLIGSVVYDSRVDLGPGGRVRLQVYTLEERQRYDDPLGELGVAQATSDVTHTVGASVRLSRPVATWLRLTGVADGRYELFEPSDADASPPVGAPATRLFGALGVEADAWWKKLRLHVIPSFRVEADRDVRSGRNPSGGLVADGMPLTNVVPLARLALLHIVTDRVTLRANAARYSRLPSTTELYGDNGFTLGNPALVPESGWNADAGVNVHLGTPRLGVTFDAAFFASLASDLIQFEQAGNGQERAFNIGRARVLGGEASVTAHLTSHCRVFVDGTYTDARDVSDTAIGSREPQLPFRPRLHLYARPEARVAVHPDLTLGAYADADIAYGNYLDSADVVLLPTRVLFGAGLYAEVPRVHLAVVASAQNLADARAFDYVGFPLPSRSFFVSARFNTAKELTP